MKIVCGITWKSGEVITENMKYLNKLSEIYLTSKNQNKADNYQLGDDGFCAIFNNAKYLLNLEILFLWSIKE